MRRNRRHGERREAIPVADDPYADTNGLWDDQVYDARTGGPGPKSARAAQEQPSLRFSGTPKGDFGPPVVTAGPYRSHRRARGALPDGAVDWAS